MALAAFQMCGTKCYEAGPPPDSILSMPPPPLPTFLLPRSAIVALSGNHSQPCFAAFMCEPTADGHAIGGPRASMGIEYVEMAGHQPTPDDTWMFVLVTSAVGVLLLGALLALILIKCRKTFGYAYTETSTKQPPLDVLCEPSMTANGKLHHHQAFLGSGTTMLYPSSTTTQTNQQMVALQQQMATENRLLWATLTPHGGTRHYVAESTYPLQDEHYEVIDFAATRPTGAAGAREAQQAVGFTEVSPQHVKRTPIKSFDNNGFIDYDYEDLAYHSDLDIDSGYQEPQEVLSGLNGGGTLSRGSPRPLVSSPTRIEKPNMAPLNMYPMRTLPHPVQTQQTVVGGAGTLGKQRISTTLSRRMGGGGGGGGGDHHHQHGSNI